MVQLPDEEELDEFEELRRCIGHSKTQFDRLSGKNAQLEQRVREIQDRIRVDRSNHAAVLRQRDVELDELRDKCRRLTSELQTMRQTKSTLSGELERYRDLLIAKAADLNERSESPPAKMARPESDL